MSKSTTTTTTVPTEAPAKSAYVYDAETAVNAYVSKAVRLDAVRKSATQAMTDAIRDKDLAKAQVHADVLEALDTASKATTSTARVITPQDYAQAIADRACAMVRHGEALFRGDYLPSDVPADQASAVKEALGALFLATDPTEEDGKEAHTFASRRVIGSSSTKAHYAAIRAGKAYDRHGASFTPEDGVVYTFAHIASLRTEAYPDGSLAPGAAAAVFIRQGEVRDPGTDYAGWTYSTMPAGSRATHGVRFTA